MGVMATKQITDHIEVGQLERKGARLVAIKINPSSI